MTLKLRSNEPRSSEAGTEDLSGSLFVLDLLGLGVVFIANNLALDAGYSSPAILAGRFFAAVVVFGLLTQRASLSQGR